MENQIITFLSVAVSACMFCITYMYAQPLKQMIETIKECVQEIKVAIDTIKTDAVVLRTDVDRLKDHEKAIWREINEIRDQLKEMKGGSSGE